MMHLTQLYQGRSTTFHEKARQLNQKYNRFSVIRLFAFILAVALMIYTFTISWVLGLLVTFTTLFLFARFVIWHQNILNQKNHCEALGVINAEEVQRLELNLEGFDSGSEFQDPLHPFAVDLDLFGRFSLFQYFNRTCTVLGKRLFANFLLQPAPLSIIHERQTAAQELSDDLEFRQNFQAIGRNTEEDALDIKRLLHWLNDPTLVLHNTLLKVALILMPLLSFITILLSFSYIPYQLIALPVGINLFILNRTLKKVNETHEKTSKASDILINYAKLIQHLENTNFQAESLKQLKGNFSAEGQTASKQLKRLSFIIHQLNARFNIFAILVNGPFLWDLQWVFQLEKWKKSMKTELPKWFDALENFDALITMGTLYYNHPDWTLPNLQVAQENLEGVGLGHPLIALNQRITNHLTFPHKAHIKLLTGSNMAGKSTFLRTVGINIVLAMMGSKVCADKLTLPWLHVFTSMRTQDALEESTSSFYAELKRLKTIIDAVENGEKVFFLLDEILKGTNSNDRHTGSKALIHQLIQSRGMGIIATHDLELGSLAASSNGAIENLCMEVEVLEDRLIFDYKIKKGVSKSFNATYLMRNMGIRVQ